VFDAFCPSPSRAVDGQRRQPAEMCSAMHGRLFGCFAGATREEEEGRVEKELANIRSKFTAARLSEYDRRKYVWKMMYISMLGYEVDFGLNEVLNLIQFPGFKDKCVGYTAATVLMPPGSEHMTAVMRTLRTDIGAEDPMLQCLALTAAANFGGKYIAEHLGDAVRNVFFSSRVQGVVRKKAALVLLRMFRVQPSLLPVTEYAAPLAEMLEVSGFGARQAVLVLILGVLAKYGPGSFAVIQAKAAALLSSARRSCPPEYVYHKVIAPWYQVRLLRVLRYFPYPSDEGIAHEVKAALMSVLRETTVTKSVNHNNAEHSILFEAINVIIRHGTRAPQELRDKAMEHLSRYVNIREPNVRYLGLESMTRMAVLPGTRDTILKQQKPILISLKERDVSLRRRALDLLFVICGKDNAQEIVEELVTHLITADVSIRTEMVLKIAILAERYAPNYRWYVDIVLKLIAHAGDHVSDDIWHRAVQIITNNASLQRYAAIKVFQAVEPSTAHETAVKVAAYILGEFGFLLQEPATEHQATGTDEDSLLISGPKQFVALHQHFDKVSTNTKMILLSSYAKLQHLYDTELDHVIRPVFEAHTTVLDQELQQRAVEYLSLRDQEESLRGTILDAMPAFAERESVLENRLKEKGKAAKDVDEWGSEAQGASEHDDEGLETAADVPDMDEGGDPSLDAGGELDLLGLGEPAGYGSSAQAAAEEADFLGLGGSAAAVADPAGPKTVAIIATRGIEPSAASTVKDQLFAFCNRSFTKGKLFEDDAVQIGAIPEFRGSLGRVRLFLGNRTSAALRAVAVDVPSSTELQVSVVDVPETIEVSGSHVVEVRVRCMQPFDSLVPLNVSFLSGADIARSTEHKYSLRLPVFANSFLEAVSMPLDAMQARWKVLTGDGKAATEPLSGGGITPTDALKALGAEVVSTAPSGAALGVATFRTETAIEGGKKLSVGCLFKLDPIDGGIQADVRTQSPVVTKALLNTLKVLVAKAT
jgi:AP-2 complex subunit alpha